MEEIFHVLYHKGMNMTAVGAYITELRIGRGLSQEVLASLIGVSDRQLRDYEKGKAEPKVGTMTRLLEAIRGTWDDVIVLLQSDATTEAARQFARQRLLHSGDEQVIADLSPEQLQAVLLMIRRLRQSPQSP